MQFLQYRIPKNIALATAKSLESGISFFALIKLQAVNGATVK